jgi:carbamoyltransferase
MAWTLGIHLGHDRAASIVKDGILHAHIAEERLDRLKHSPFLSIPFRSIDALLRLAHLRITDFAAIGVTYTRFKVGAFLTEVRDQLDDYYGVTPPTILSVSHHLAHALSSFHTSDFKEALLFVADGSGDRVEQDMVEAESWYLATSTGIELLGRRLQEWIPDVYNNPFLYLYPLMQDRERSSPMSLGYKYEQFTSMLGFGRQQEGTTMALAAYGRPLVDVRQHCFNSLDYSVARADLLDRIDAIRASRGLGYAAFIRRERRNLAATVQSFVEHGVLSILSSIRAQVGPRRLGLAGGLFLNCVLNSKVLHSGLFDQVHIVPTAGDDGQSIGAAFHAYNVACGRAGNSSRALPYLGIQYKARRIRRAITLSNLRYEHHKDTSLAKRIVSFLLEGKTVGLFRGRSEAGPRALCHRSILADPRSSRIRDHLNVNVKRREIFRPFAPVVCAEDQDTFFQLNQSSPYMVLSGTVRRQYRRALSGITHVDGSARLQSISEAADPVVHMILKFFAHETGFPILLNTSFNGKGEPIVESPEDAISAFLRMGIDALALENFFIVAAQ